MIVVIVVNVVVRTLLIVTKVEPQIEESYLCGQVAGSKIQLWGLLLLMTGVSRLF